MNKLFDILKKYDYVVVFVLLTVLSIILMARTTYYQRSNVWTSPTATGAFRPSMLAKDRTPAS